MKDCVRKRTICNQPLRPASRRRIAGSVVIRCPGCFKACQSLNTKSGCVDMTVRTAQCLLIPPLVLKSWQYDNIIIDVVGLYPRCVSRRSTALLNRDGWPRFRPCGAVAMDPGTKTGDFTMIFELGFFKEALDQ